MQDEPKDAVKELWHQVLGELSEKMDLPRIYGEVLASTFMLAALLPALVKAGALDRSQVDDMLTQASAHLDLSVEAHLSKRPQEADFLAKSLKQAQTNIGTFRGLISSLDQ